MQENYEQLICPSTRVKSMCVEVTVHIIILEDRRLRVLDSYAQDDCWVFFKVDCFMDLPSIKFIIKPNQCNIIGILSGGCCKDYFQVELFHTVDCFPIHLNVCLLEFYRKPGFLLSMHSNLWEWPKKEIHSFLGGSHARVCSACYELRVIHNYTISNGAL